MARRYCYPTLIHVAIEDLASIRSLLLTQWTREVGKVISIYARSRQTFGTIHRSHTGQLQGTHFSGSYSTEYPEEQINDVFLIALALTDPNTWCSCCPLNVLEDSLHCIWACGCWLWCSQLTSWVSTGHPRGGQLTLAHVLIGEPLPVCWKTPH